MKIDYAKLFTLRSDGRYQGYWHDLVDGKPIGARHTICDRDPKRLYDRIAEKESPTDNTFGAIAREWWDKHVTELERGTQRSYLYPFNKAVAEFGNMQIDKISAADISALLLREKNRDKSYYYIAMVRCMIKQVFDYAIISKRLNFNPTLSVSVPKGAKRGRVEAPSKETIEIVKRNLDKPFGDFVAMLLYTGMRTEEAAALLWIDIGEEFINVHNALDLSGTPKLKSTKTKAGVRKIPILDPLKPYLVKPKKAALNDHVFNSKGHALTRGQIDYRWTRWCAAAGLADEITITVKYRDGTRERTRYVPLVHPHQLRHHFATVLFEAGFDELITQKIMGHESLDTTRRIYTSIREDFMDEQYKKLNDIF